MFREDVAEGGGKFSGGFFRTWWPESMPCPRRSESQFVYRHSNLQIVDACPGPLVADQFGLNNELNASAIALSDPSPFDPTRCWTPLSDWWISCETSRRSRCRFQRPISKAAFVLSVARSMIAHVVGDTVPFAIEGFEKMNAGAEHQSAASPEDLSRFFVEGANAGDVEGLVALYEPGAVLASPSGQVATGHQAIRVFHAGLLAARPTFAAGDRRPSLRNGDLTLTSTLIPAGATAEVARRQADGGWLWLLDQPNFLG
ncbi:YybH family protein [Pseudarthrobacter sp. S9]|uniref:YybH family protein n=1 Tax=Pseudarthrobacter sp. S9 TaxID=3418421 RepID=UPI003CFFFA06